MKKNLTIILLILLSSGTFIFSQSRTIPVDIRAEGMGSAVLTDTESVYTLFRNPAGLGLSDKQNLFTIFPMGVGGELESLGKLANKLLTGTTQEELTNLLSSMIGSNGFNFNTRIGGPLTFGGITKNHIGWGVLNTVAIEGNVPSLTKSDIAAKVGFDLAIGYGHPFDFGKGGALSVGFSARLISQVGFSYTGAVTDLISNMDFSSMPMNVGFGLGLDLGLQYKVYNLLSFAVVLSDFYSPVWTKNMSNSIATFEYDTIPTALSFGVGFDIPLECYTKNIISHFGITADYKNVIQLFDKKTAIVARNPWLELAVGMEMVVWDLFALRIGIAEMYPSAGLGLYAGPFRIDYSIYGKELGLEPGDNPQLNMGLAISFQY